MMKTKDKGRTVRLKIVHTSDVHGHFFLWDQVLRKPVKGGLARVYAYVQSLRGSYGDRLLLLDGGDILQGSPLVYYSNHMLSDGQKNLTAEVMNYMRYDVGTIGNHDIETGHAVYDRWAEACHFPIVAANVMNRATGSCYFRPYAVVEKSGARVAVLGLTTPAVPNWLPPALWSGLEFEDMVTCAARWVPLIRERERPDVLVGLFHSGKEGGIVTPDYAENAALEVARRVAGIDVVCYGHDHLKNCETVTGPDGRGVVCCSPSSMGVTVCEVDLEIETAEAGGKRVKGIQAKLTDLAYYKGKEARYMQRYFSRYIRNTEYCIGQKIGRFSRTISSQDAYFGPSAFVDLVHRAQLQVTGAQVSFASPVSFSAEIRAGDVFVRDVFSLYKYDDVLYTMRLTGAEIKGILEMSYGLWVGQMQSPDDHIMQLDYVLDDGKRLGFKNLAYNFDSAAGICYTVDVTRPCGQKITVTGMADGTPFDETATYAVAANSYRGNGGGDLFVKGAGIPRGQLSERLLSATEKDLRQCLVDYIKAQETVDLRPLGCWRFVPEEWAVLASRRDRELLFGQGTERLDGIHG